MGFVIYNVEVMSYENRQDSFPPWSQGTFGGSVGRRDMIRSRFDYE